MIFGMTAFTFVHVVLSLIGIGAGLIVAVGLLIAKRLDGWSALFFGYAKQHRMLKRRDCMPS
jgi:hypothetical protein